MPSAFEYCVAVSLAPLQIATGCPVVTTDMGAVLCKELSVKGSFRYGVRARAFIYPPNAVYLRLLFGPGIILW